MENKSHALIAGLFTITLGIALALAALWLSRDRTERVPYELITRSSIAGLTPQAEVRYRGLAVGTVEQIGFDPKVPGQILVRIGVAKGTPITRSTFATLGYQGLTGLAYVQLDDDGKSAELLESKPDAVARLTIQPGLLEMAAKRAENILMQAEEVSQRLNTLLDGANQKRFTDVLESMNGAAQELGKIGVRLEPTLERLPGLVTQAQKSMEGLPGLVTQAQKSMEGLPGLVTQTQKSMEGLPGLVTQAQKSMEGLPGLVTQAQKSMEGLPGLVTQVQKSMEGLPGLVTQAHKSIEGVPALVTQAHKTMEGLPGLVSEAQKTMADLGAAGKDFAALTARLQEKGGALEQVTVSLDRLAETGSALMLDTLPRVNRFADTAASSARSLSRMTDKLGERPQSLLFGGGGIAPGPGEPGHVPAPATAK